MRLAVRVGGARVAVARAGPPPKPARAPASDPARAVALGSLAGLDPARAVRAAWTSDDRELVLVHPTRWPPARLRAQLRELAPPGAAASGDPAALALARELHARAPLPPGPLCVLEGDGTGVHATVLADPTSGRVLAGRFAAAPVRPAVLLDRVAVAAGLTAPGLTAGVLVVRDVDGPGPLGPAALDELTDVLGRPPTVVADADALAALGALRPPAPGAGPPVRPAERAPRVRLGEGLLGPVPRRRRSRPLLTALAVALGCGLLAWLGARPVDADVPVAAGADPAGQAARGGVLAQYDYALVVPPGWRQSGGLPQRRRTLLSPSNTPDGSDLISVEQTLLGYDSAAEPDRARRELRARFDWSVAQGARLADFSLSTRIGGREVVAYRQRQPLRAADVDWYVLFAGDSELSVGCQHTAAGTDRVRAACAEVVASLRPAAR